MGTPDGPDGYYKSYFDELFRISKMHIAVPKPKPNRRDKHTDPYYQSSEWRRKKNEVWKRDKGLCQICAEQGKLHPLIRGTRDLRRQGTVDHIIPRKAGGSDDLTNLRLIGTMHHAAKSAKDKRHYG